MNRLVYSICIILISIGTRITYGFPGPFLCYYFGNAELTCGGRPVQVSALPNECTCFVFDGIVIDRRVDTSSTNHNQQMSPQTGGPPDQFSYLDAVMSSDKEVLVCFYHADNDKFRYDSPKIEMRSEVDTKFIMWFISSYTKLKGIIINDVDFKEYKADFVLFAQRFQVYMHSIRTAAKDFFIGISVPSHFMIDEFSNTNSALKFSTFDMEVDFYMFTFGIFNPCTPGLRKGGVVPYDSNEANVYTLKRLEVALKNAGIPKEKIYFKFQLFGISDRTGDLTFYDECFTSYERICKYPNITANWCADNSESLRIKGKFAKDFGAGFIMDSIDLNDPANRCNCKTPFPSMYYLIDGYEGKQSFPPCPMFDRTTVP